jgi:hypothetical protein
MIGLPLLNAARQCSTAANRIAGTLSDDIDLQATSARQSSIKNVVRFSARHQLN